MNIADTIVNLLLHVDQYLDLLIKTFGNSTYLILFAIIFAETGLVFTPFFPGDSLLFIAGTFAAEGSLNLSILFAVFALGAIVGDTANYWIGHSFGKRVLHKNSRFFKEEYLVEAEKFYEKHGGKTIVIARFVPIIRTFAPFVAGIGTMSYRWFIVYNIVGGIAWVAIFLMAGYFFGTIPVVRNNLSFVIIAIIIVSLVPAASRFFSHISKKQGLRRERPEPALL
jgi:membrane-associated protein